MKRSVFFSVAVLAILATAFIICLLTWRHGADECDHRSVRQRAVAAECDEPGGTLNLCLECGEEFLTDTQLPLGHALTRTAVAPTCDEPGYLLCHCERCGIEYTTDYQSPTGHSLSFRAVLPDCDDEGYTVACCEACGYSYVSEVTAPTAHRFESAVKYACALDGVGSTTYTCECGFCYVGDLVFYSDIFKGAYSENEVPLAKGVDVSYHNHSLTPDGSGRVPLDWQAIRAAGYDFAILRAGYIGVRDVVFDINYEQARAAGLELGAYFYSYADSIQEAREEAYFCLSLLEGKQFEYPIFFDIEDPRLEGLGRDLLTDICVEFISILQQHGYYAALYTNNRWLTTLLQTEKITTLFDVWYARYPSATEIVTDAKWNTEKYGAQTVMWQFSQTGVIDGFYRPDGTPIHFDLNYVYRDYPTLIRELGYNGFGENRRGGE